MHADEVEVRTTELLRRMTKLAGEASVVREAVQEALEAIGELAGFAIGHAYLVVEGGAIERVDVQRLEDRERFLPFWIATLALTSASDEPLLEAALESASVVESRDLSKGLSPRRAEAAKACGLTSGVAIPALTDRGVTVVMELWGGARAEMSPALRAALEVAGAAVARVAERARAAEAAARGKVLVEEVSRAKSMLLTTMSQELRSPLNVIIGYSEFLSETCGDEGLDRIKADLEKIEASGRHLLALINDVLDLERIEAGSMELRVNDVPVDPLIDVVADITRGLCVKNANTIAVDRRGRLGLVRADPIKLRQVLLSVLSNAATFTVAGTVTLRVTREEDGERAALRFDVSDTGVGLSNEQIEAIFGGLYGREGSGGGRRFGGRGLGLALARRLCRMMGGDITAKSAVGKGSTFTIRLPAGPE